MLEEETEEDEEGSDSGLAFFFAVAFLAVAAVFFRLGGISPEEGRGEEKLGSLLG